jgi:thymidylate kinase
VQLITISGLDGSGKSTQVEALRSYFAGRGETTHYFHSIQFSVANSLSRARRRGSGAAVTEPEGGTPTGEKPGVTSASRPSILLRKIFLRIDLVRFRALLRKLERAGVSAVISDRYFYDNIVNIAYLERSSRLMAVSPPRPDHAFYLRVDPARIMARDRAPEQGLDYLITKLALYDALAAARGLTILDGAKPPATVTAALLSSLAPATS